jgi:hypothetical protein
MLSVVEVIFFCYAEYHYAECHYAECHGAASKAFQGVHVSFLASSSLTNKRHFKE